MVALVVPLFLQGCKVTSGTLPVKNSNNINISLQDKSKISSLQECLKNTDELVKLNSKYKSDYNEIHYLIREAKSYTSSTSGNISESIEETITPLFEYKINYKCNKIGQLLIDEYNNRVQKTIPFTGDR